MLGLLEGGWDLLPQPATPTLPRPGPPPFLWGGCGRGLRYPEKCQPVRFQGTDHPKVAQGGHKGLPRQQGLQDHQAAAQHPQDGWVLAKLLRKPSLLLGPLLFLGGKAG